MPTRGSTCGSASPSRAVIGQRPRPTRPGPSRRPGSTFCLCPTPCPGSPIVTPPSGGPIPGRLPPQSRVIVASALALAVTTRLTAGHVRRCHRKAAHQVILEVLTKATSTRLRRSPTPSSLLMCRRSAHVRGRGRGRRQPVWRTPPGCGIESDRPARWRIAIRCDDLRLRCAGRGRLGKSLLLRREVAIFWPKLVGRDCDVIEAVIGVAPQFVRVASSYPHIRR